MSEGTDSRDDVLSKVRQFSFIGNTREAEELLKKSVERDPSNEVSNNNNNNLVIVNCRIFGLNILKLILIFIKMLSKSVHQLKF